MIKNSFINYIKSETPLETLLSETNAILLKNNVHPQIQFIKGNYELAFISQKKEKNNLLILIAIEVIKLLNTKEFKYLKKCDNHQCSLLYIDTSKNHSRRWCSMESCGNRSKVNNFNKRQKFSKN